MVRKVLVMANAKLLLETIKVISITLLVLLTSSFLYQKSVLVDNLLLNNPTGLGYHDVHKNEYITTG
jgi:hypothetical protein